MPKFTPFLGLEWNGDCSEKYFLGRIGVHSCSKCPAFLELVAERIEIWGLQIGSGKYSWVWLDLLES